MKNDVTAPSITSAAHFIPTIALCLFAWSAIASAEPAPGVNRTKYGALQSISQIFGSKFTSGYFVSETGKCLVTLMVAEKSDPESPSSQTAARVRLALNPGQVAGLDSEEGEALNFTCGTNAAALMVDRGAKDALSASQKRALSSENTVVLPWSDDVHW